MIRALSIHRVVTFLWIFFCAFIFPTSLLAQDNSLNDNERSLREARGELLQMLMSDLKLRSDNELCVFNEGSAGFSKAVVSPCRSLLDRILTEALEGEISQPLLDTQVSRSLLRYLLLELARIKSFTKSEPDVALIKVESSSSDNNIEELYLRVARVLSVLLRISEQKADTDIRARVIETILNSYDEFIEMISDLGEEYSVVSLSELLLTYENEFNAKGHRGQLLMLILSILYNDNIVMSAHLEKLASLYRMRMFDLLDSNELLALLGKINFSSNEFSGENINYVKNVLDFYKSCSSVLLKGEIQDSSFCSEFPWSIGPALRLLFSDLLISSLAADFESRPLRYVQDERLRLPDFLKESESFLGFKEMILLPAFEKMNLSKSDALKACETLSIEHSCSLAPVQEETLEVQSFSLNKGTYLVLVLFAAFVLNSLLYFKFPRIYVKIKERVFTSSFSRLFNFLKSLQSTSPTEGYAHSLSTEERKELRELREYFKLSPTQGLDALQKKYRRYVLKTHPDRVKDEGEAFIQLQERFERAKSLLDRLDDEREKRLSNDLN